MELDKLTQQPGASQLDQPLRTSALDALTRGIGPAKEGQTDSQGMFSGILERLGKAVSGTQGGARQAVERFSKGVEGEVHESMMAIEKADISFKFVNTVFKKGIDAYKEITQRMG